LTQLENSGLLLSRCYWVLDQVSGWIVFFLTSLTSWTNFFYSTRKNYLIYYSDLPFKSCHGFIIIFKFPYWKDLHFL